MFPVAVNGQRPSTAIPESHSGPFPDVALRASGFFRFASGSLDDQLGVLRDQSAITLIRQIRINSNLNSDCDFCVIGVF